MFDIGFLEIAVIAVIGLIVIGPERLPEAVRSGATWMAKIRKMMRDTRAEIEVQIGADDIRRELHNEQIMKSLEALKVTKDDIHQHILDADRKMSLEDETEEAKLQTPVSRRVAGDDPTLGTDENVFTDPAYAHAPEETSEAQPDATTELSQEEDQAQQPTTKAEPTNDR